MRQRSLKAGRGFIDPLDRIFQGNIHASASHPPLFPAVLSAVSFLGGTSLLAHQLTESLLDSLAVVAIGLLGFFTAGTCSLPSQSPAR